MDAVMHPFMTRVCVLGGSSQAGFWIFETTVLITFPVLAFFYEWEYFEIGNSSEF